MPRVKIWGLLAKAGLNFDRGDLLQAQNNLEQLKPLVKNNQVDNINSNYCIISIPLLLETDASNIVDRILVIDVPRELQLVRASYRDKTSEKDIDAIIDSQISRKDRLAAANDIVDNKGDINDLRKKIYDLHEFYSNI